MLSPTLLFACLLAFTFADELPKFMCDYKAVQEHVDDRASWCVYQRLQVTTAAPNWIPRWANSVSNIKKVQMVGKTFEVLTDDLCKALPDLEKLDINGVGLKEVRPNALERCTKLKLVYFRNGNLTTLDKNTFKSNPDLQVIRIDHNNIIKIDPTWFEANTKLTKLVVGNQGDNSQITFPIDKFPTLSNLNYLGVEGIKLSELPAAKTIAKFPALKTLKTYDRFTPCSTVEQDVKTYKSKGIEVSEGILDVKPPGYTIDRKQYKKIDDVAVHCKP